MSANRIGIQLLALALMLAALCGCSSGKAPAEESTEPVSSAGAFSSAVEEEPKEPEYILYPGFVDQVFTEENAMLAMDNSEKNAVAFRFAISVEGETVFTSEEVTPGESAQWDVTSKWSEGEHQVTITSVPVLEDGVEGNASSQTITITIEAEE